MSYSKNQIFISLCVLLSLFGFINGNALATTVIYPPPDGIVPAPDFQVNLNGQSSFVHDLNIGAYTAFSTDTEVLVEIITTTDVKWVDIRPKSLEIDFDLKDNKISFKMNASNNISVELNGNLKRPIFVFANKVDHDKPDNNGDGVRYFKAGKKYNVGHVVLHSNETVYIEGGAVVKGSFEALNAENVVICGYGILDGTNVRGEVGYREAVKNYRTWRKLIHFKNCTNSRIEGIILANSNAWNVVPDHSKGIIIDNIKIVCSNPSDDAIDILQSEDITIKNCFIRSKDDCIAIKALFDQPMGRKCRNINVNNCVIWSAEWGNGFEIGFETLVPLIEDVHIENCDVIHVEGGAVFSIHNSDYAMIRSISYKNIRIEDARDKLLDLAIFVSLFSKDNPYDIDDFRKNHYLNGAWANVMDLSGEKPDKYSVHRGKIEHIIFENIQIVEGLFPYSVINGFDINHMVKDVVIKDLSIYGETIKDLKDAKIFTKFCDGVVIK